MKKLLSTVALGIAALTIGQAASADPSRTAKLVIDGTEISTHAKGMAGGPLDELYSGWLFRSDETRALQLDDFDNPAFVFVDDGETLFDTVDGSEGKSCSSCHEAGDFKGLRPVLPRWNEAKGKIYSMENYINDCRTERMGAEKWKWSKPKMTSMVALISLQSRGLPINVATDGPVADIYEKGKELYYTRVGQLDMACSNCHEDNYGNMIRADHLSQGQVNGFPTYRLKNAKLNSIHARFKGCMKNIRAEPYGQGSDEFQALELYVASRGNGLSVEAPSVRN